MDKELHSRKKAAGSKAKKIILWILASLFSLIVIVCVAAFIYINNIYNLRSTEAEEVREEDIYINPELLQPQTSSEDSQETKGTDSEPELTDIINKKQSKDSYTMIMLYGIDSADQADTTRYGNGDSEIICCINNETYEIKLISLLRDTFLETTKGKHNKLTDIYSAYGVKESLGTINKCFDLQITKYVSINWKSLAEAVNAIGGIDIVLTEKEANYVIDCKGAYSDILKMPTGDLNNRGDGEYHLDGVQTLAHAANRTVGHHDISRAERQRNIIKAVLAKAKTCSFSELEDAVKSVMPGIATNIGLVKILDLALDANKYYISDSALFPFDYRDQSNLITAYVYCTTLESNVTDLHAMLFGEENYKPTNTVREVSSYITSYRRQHP